MELCWFVSGQVWDPETSTEGWFKLMDEKKGVFLHQKFVPKYKAKPGALGAPGTPAPAPAAAAAATPTKRPAAAVPAPPATSKRAAAAAPAKPRKVAAPAKVSAADFTYTKVLGRGSFGKVLLAEKAGDSDVFAIKVLKKTSVVEDDDVAGTFENNMQSECNSRRIGSLSRVKRHRRRQPRGTAPSPRKPAGRPCGLCIARVVLTCAFLTSTLFRYNDREAGAGIVAGLAIPDQAARHLPDR